GWSGRSAIKLKGQFSSGSGRARTLFWLQRSAQLLQVLNYFVRRKLPRVKDPTWVSAHPRCFEPVRLRADDVEGIARHEPDVLLGRISGALNELVDRWIGLESLDRVRAHNHLEVLANAGVL